MKVKCDYCGSYVNYESNCPNCNAPLPNVKETYEIKELQRKFNELVFTLSVMGELK